MLDRADGHVNRQARILAPNWLTPEQVARCGEVFEPMAVFSTVGQHHAVDRFTW